MICSDCVIAGDVKIIEGAVIHPKVAITADPGSESSVGTKTIIEETSRVHNSSIGWESLLEVGVVATSVRNAPDTPFNLLCFDLVSNPAL